ncbi:hypothetical protein P4S63_00695 [Pseudoalteromonas sp. B193]
MLQDEVSQIRGVTEEQSYKLEKYCSVSVSCIKRLKTA